MSLVGSLPYTLTNGTTADANQVQANMQYIVDQVNTNAVARSGGIMSGALTNASGFVGPLTGNVTGNVAGNLTGNVTGNLTGSVTGNVTGNVTGSSGSCTGNSATATNATTAAACSGNAATATTATIATTVSNGAITPAKLSTGGLSWDASGNLTIGPTMRTLDTGSGGVGGSVLLQFDPGCYIQFERATQKFIFVIGNVEQMSIDNGGNIRAAASIFPNTPP